jgi:predicted nucleic acid-binding protein
VIVVADTSPLNYLIQLGQAVLLNELYGQVLVPEAVARELAHAAAPEIVRSWIGSPPAWLTIVAVRDRDLSLPFQLGEGESEAISLALELNLAVLLDDQRARKEAELRNVPTAGTLAVLVQGALRKKLNLEDALHHLRLLQFRISYEIEAHALARYRTLSKDL